MEPGPQQRFSLDGKVAIVTGASRGIGEAIARGLADAGARVVIASRKEVELRMVEESILASGGTAMAMACHMGDPDQVRALVTAAVERFGAVDVLVNNAATNLHFGLLIDAPPAAFDKTFEVNVKGYFHAAREVIRHLSGRGAPGSIINLTSVFGMRSAPMQGVYGMTKAAVISMTQTLAYEVGGRGIRVNAIAPGLVETRFSQPLIANEALRDPIVARTPLGRHGQPGDIVGAALFLASDAAVFVNGHTLIVDGGVNIS